MVGLGTLYSGYPTKALAVSADGSVIVGQSRMDDLYHSYDAFIWREGEGMCSIKYLLENDYGLDLTGWQLTEAHDISGDGTRIIGMGYNPDGYEESWMATIPEPGLCSLMTLGGLALMRRRRN